jgi:hypothetical protein
MRKEVLFDNLSYVRDRDVHERELMETHLSAYEQLQWQSCEHVHTKAKPRNVD